MSNLHLTQPKQLSLNRVLEGVPKPWRGKHRARDLEIYTVKLGNKERFDKEQIGIKALIMDYQTFYTINLLLDKELLPI